MKGQGEGLRGVGWARSLIAALLGVGPGGCHSLGLAPMRDNEDEMTTTMSTTLIRDTTY